MTQSSVEVGKLRLAIMAIGSVTWAVVVYAATFVNTELIGLAQTVTPVMLGIVAALGTQEYLERKKNGNGNGKRNG